MLLRATCARFIVYYSCSCFFNKKTLKYLHFSKTYTIFAIAICYLCCREELLHICLAFTDAWTRLFKLRNFESQSPQAIVDAMLVIILSIITGFMMAYNHIGVGLHCSFWTVGQCEGLKSGTGGCIKPTLLVYIPNTQTPSLKLFQDYSRFVELIESVWTTVLTFKTSDFFLKWTHN